MRVSIIIPTHNEALAIGKVLADIPADLVTEVIVVDSNSTDGTAEIAERAGARVIFEQRRGYGQACLTGLANANSPDVVVFLDGDYSDRPAELPLLLAPISDGRADITLGSRLAGPRIPGALPWHSAFGNRLAAGLISLLFQQRITDLGPFRAGARGCPSCARTRRNHLWLGGGNYFERRAARVPHRRGAGELLPAHRKIEDQRHDRRHARRGLVHFHSHSALLFPPATSWNAAVCVKPATTIY